jgi:FAD/FMN-containing dehydrogenase
LYSWNHPKIEAGRRRPSPQLIERLAAALQIPSTDRRAFQQLARGQARVAPFIALPASSNHFPPTDQTLPMPLTPLIGRDADRATIYERVRAAGGTLYPVSAFPMSRDDWRKHFGPAWERLRDAKRNFDPGHILTPGYEVF